MPTEKAKRMVTILWPAIVLTAICAIVTLVLALTYTLTEPTIAALNAESETAAVKEVLPGDYTPTSLDVNMNGVTKVYTAMSGDGAFIGYAMVCSSKGYGGDIQLMVGIGDKGQVTGVKILSDNETPGLGKKAEDASFTDRYKKDKAVSQYEVVKGTAQEDAQIDAITGATITSKAVTNGVNAALAAYRELLQGNTAMGLG